MTDDMLPDTSGAPLLPTRQELVPFYDGFIVAALLPDGRIAATLASLCERLGLAPNRQVRRIRADDLLADEFLPATIETSGGPQTMGVLTAWAIPLWLTGVQVSRVAEEKRPMSCIAISQPSSRSQRRPRWFPPSLSRSP